MSKRTTSYLHVIATDRANVRETEPDGTVLPGVRIVGKAVDHETQQAHIIPSGVILPFSAYLIDNIQKGYLLPGNSETAGKAGLLAHRVFTHPAFADDDKE
jgi:hypothetical protein